MKIKIIVAGPRRFTDYGWLWRTLDAVKAKLEARGDELVVISGMARGADIMGWIWAKLNDVAVLEFPVTKQQWDTIGPSAGHRRNEQMALAAKQGGQGGLLAFWDGKTAHSGTLGMIQRATKMHLIVKVYEYVEPAPAEYAQAKRAADKWVEIMTRKIDECDRLATNGAKVAAPAYDADWVGLPHDYVVGYTAR